MDAVCGSLRFYNLVKVNDKELLALKMRSQAVWYIEPTLLAGWSGVRISAVARGFSLPQNVQTGCWAHQASYSVCTGLFPVGSDVDHSPPYTAEVEDEWGCTSSPPISLNCMNGDNFTFYVHQHRMRILATSNVAGPFLTA